MFKKIYEFYLFINPTLNFYRDMDSEYGGINSDDNIVREQNFQNKGNILNITNFENDGLKKLREEILAMGGKIKNLEVREKNGIKENRAIVASDFIMKNFEVMKIPNDLVLSKFHPKISEFCKSNKIPLDTDYDCLLSFLLYEQILVETNQPKLSLEILNNYFRTLPNDFSNFPFNYNNYELYLLKDTFFYKRLQKYKDEYEQTFENVSKHFSKMKILLDKEKFKKCYLVLFSRSFGMDTEEGTFDALIPYGDMFNTSISDQERCCFWYFDEEKNFHVESGRDINKDEEICIRYGDGYNSDFLLFYGFTVANNPNGKIENFEIKDKSGSVLNEISMKTNPTIRNFNLEKLREKFAVSIENGDKFDDLYFWKLIEGNLNESLKFYENNFDQTQILEMKKEHVIAINFINIKRIVEEEKLVLEANLKFVRNVIKYLKNEVGETNIINLGEFSLYDVSYFQKMKYKF